MRRALELICGWVFATFALVFLAVIIKPLMAPAFIVWVCVTVTVSLDLSRDVRRHRRALRDLKAALLDPRAHRVVVLPPEPPRTEPIEPSGMIVLPPQDRDPRWEQARERQRLQQSGQLHVDRELRSLTDCPAGHYDYHELRESSLDQVVRRCAWCPPSADTWTERPMGSKGSKR